MNNEPDITKVGIRWPEYSHSVTTRDTVRYAEPLEVEPADYSPTFFERVSETWARTKIYIKITTAVTPYIPKIILGLVMRNWKTTITAIVGAVASFIGAFGFHVTPEVQGAIITITLLVMSFFTRDAGTGSDAK